MPAVTGAGVEPRALRCGIVETEAGLRNLETEWDEVLRRMARPSPFLSWTWVVTWWEQFAGGSRLYVVTARNDGGELVGVAPLHIVARRAMRVLPVRSLEFLGHRGSAVCADYLDFLAPAQAAAAVVGALAGELWRRRTDWDVLAGADLDPGSQVPAAWRRIAPKSMMTETEAQTCPVVALPASCDRLWSSLRQRHARFVKAWYRDWRRLQRHHHVRFLPETGTQDLAVAMEDMARLHQLARQRHGERGNFQLPDYRRFHEQLAPRLAARGELYLARLACDGEVVASMYGYVMGDVLYCYQTGFDSAWGAWSVGKLLLGCVLEDAIRRLQVNEFDFLRGTEVYKAHWATAQRHTRNFMCWQAGAGARAARLAWAAGQQRTRLGWLLSRWGRRDPA